MSDKNELSKSITDEVKDQAFKHTLSKFEYDLYHEEDDIINKIIRVKRTSSNKNESWKIFEDKKVKFTVDGSKLSKKEKEFLRSVDGFNFLIAEAKKGIASFNALKKVIKDYLRSA